MNKKTAVRTGLPFIIVTFTLSLYISTLLPGVSPDGDEAKFQFIGKILGVPHTTGFPAYVLLNWLFVHLVPLKSIAWRANLMSAVWSSATCLTLYFLILKITRYKFLAFATTILFSTTCTFWRFSLTARHYTLNLFFFCMVIFLLIRWHSERKKYLLYLGLAIYSISLGNHPTIILLLPAIVYIIFITDRKIFLDRKTLLSYLSMAAIGCLLYSYLFIRSYQKAPYLEGSIYSLRDFIYYISGDYFRSDLYNFSMRKIIPMARSIFLDSLLRKQFSFPLLAPLGILGILLSLKKRVKLCLFLLLTIVPTLLWALFSDYGVLPARYFLTVYLVFAVFIALGIYYLLESISARKTKKIIYLLASLYLLASIQFLVKKNYDLADQSKNTGMQMVVEKALSRIGKNAVILAGTYNYFEAFSYYLLIDERWKDKNIRLILVYKTPGKHVQIEKFPRQGTQTIYCPTEDRKYVQPLNLPIYTICYFPDLKSQKVINISDEVDLYQIF